MANQMNSMSLDNQSNSARSDMSSQSDKQHQQLTSPTSPAEITASPAEIAAAAAQRKHYVYYSSGDQQIHQTGQYHQSIAGYPVQYYQNVPTGYANYQDPNIQMASTPGQQQQQPTTPNSMQPPPSPTIPGLISQHYATATPANIPSQGTALIQPTPEQQQYLASVSAHLSGQRPRFTSGAIGYPRHSSNQIYVPVAGQPQQLAMYMSGGQGQYVNGQKNVDYYRMNRMNNTTVDTADYRKIDTHHHQYQQSYALQQSSLTLAQHHRPSLMQIPTHYQQYYMAGAPKRYSLFQSRFQITSL